MLIEGQSRVLPVILLNVSAKPVRKHVVQALNHFALSMPEELCPACARLVADDSGKTDRLLRPRSPPFRRAQLSEDRYAMPVYAKIGL
jgi:hypothetical protein